MKIGSRDDFENRYMAKFRAISAEFGVFVEYERDRAARDIGVHLTRPNQSRDGFITTPALLWFQMKGIMADTLSLSDYEAAIDVAIDLDVGHLRFWYLNVLPTYLAVYVESADRFLAIDITKWVAENHGEKILTHKKKTVRVRIDKKDVLDGDFFRIALNRNLVPVLRKSLTQEDDAGIDRFLRDSSVVKWLSDCQKKDVEARMTVVKYMSKMRTEAHFERMNQDGSWEPFRIHWQYAMGDLAEAFPYLIFRPERNASLSRWPEEIDDYDGTSFTIWHESFSVVDTSTGEEIDEDDFDGECLLDIGNNELSYGHMGGGEVIHHSLRLGLNEIGKRWAATLEILVEAEVITVDVEPHMISVAPWHHRNL